MFRRERNSDYDYIFEEVYLSFTLEEYFDIVIDYMKYRYPKHAREIPRFGLPLKASHRTIYIPFVFEKPKKYYPFEEHEIAIVPRTLYQKWFDPNDKDAKEEYQSRWFNFFQGYEFESYPSEEEDMSYIIEKHKRLEVILDRGQGSRIGNAN